MKKNRFTTLAIAGGMLATLGLADIAVASYVQAVNDLNPIRYYRFEESTTNSGDALVDETGTDSITYSSTATAGTGPALAGVGSNQYAATGGLLGVGTVTADLPAGNADRTFMFWYRENSSPQPAPVGTIVGYGGNGAQATSQAMMYFGGSSGQLLAGSAGFSQVDGADLADGQWHFAVISIEATTPGNATWTIYQATQGDSAVTQTGLNTMNTSTIVNSPLVLGAAPFYAPFVGDLDEVAIFDFALTEQQANDVLNGVVIPEPASLALLGIGLAVIAGRRRA